MESGQQLSPTCALKEKQSKNTRRSRRRRRVNEGCEQGAVVDEQKNADEAVPCHSVCNKSNNDSDGETTSEKRSENSDSKDHASSSTGRVIQAGKSSDDEADISSPSTKRKSRAKHRREVKKYKHRMAQKQKQLDAEMWHNELYLLRDTWETDATGTLAETATQNVVLSEPKCERGSERIVGCQCEHVHTATGSLNPLATPFGVQKQAPLSPSVVDGSTDGGVSPAVCESPISTMISGERNTPAQGEFDFEFFSIQDEQAEYPTWPHSDVDMHSPYSWTNDGRYASAIVDSTFLAELSRRMSVERTTLKETVPTHRSNLDATAKVEKATESRQVALALSRSSDITPCRPRVVRPPKSSYPIVAVNDGLNQSNSVSGGGKRHHIQLRHVEAVPPVPMPVPLAPGTDLILPPRNYLTIDPVFNTHVYMPGLHRDEKVLSQSLISTALCNKCVSACDGALVVSSDDALRSLFEAALDDKPVAISAHRVGHMVLLTSEQPKLLKTTAEKKQEQSLVGKTMYRINESLAEADATNHDCEHPSKVTTTNTANDVFLPDNDAVSTKTCDTRSRKELGTRLPLQVASTDVEKYSHCNVIQNVCARLEQSKTGHHQSNLRVGTINGNRAAERRSRYSRMLHWKMGSLGLLVGLNTPVVLDQRTNVEAILSLADASRPIPSDRDKQHSALRSWFDATLANVGSVGVYTHDAGIVKRFDVRKVSDLLDAADGRLASAAMNFTSDALHWIVSQCSRDGRSYAVVRNYTTNTLEIYESPQPSNAWDCFVSNKHREADMDENMCIGGTCFPTGDGNADDVLSKDREASPPPPPPPCIAGPSTKNSRYSSSSMNNKVVCAPVRGNENATQQQRAAVTFAEGSECGGEPNGVTATTTAADEDANASRRREEAAGTNWKLGIMCFHIATRLCEDDECVAKAVPLLERCFSIFIQQSHRPEALRHLRAVAEMLVSIVQRLLACTKIAASAVYTDLPCKYRDALLTCSHFATRIYHALQEKSIHSTKARVVFIECLLFGSAAICIAVARTIARVNVIRDVFRKLRETSVRPDRDSNLEIHNKVMKDMLQVAVEGLVKLEWARNVLLAAVETPHFDATGTPLQKGAGALVDARLGVPRIESVDTSVSELYGDLILLTMSDPSPFTAQVLADVSLRIMSRDPATSHLTTLQWLSTIKHDQVTLSFTALKSYGKAGSTRRLLLKNAHVYYFVGCHYLATDRHTKALEALHRSDKLFSVAELAEEDFTFCCCATETFITKEDIYCVLGEVYLRMARVRVGSSDSPTASRSRAQPDCASTRTWPEIPLAFGGASHLSAEEERCWTNAIDYFSKSGSAHAHMAITLLAFVSRRIDTVVASGVRASAAFARDAAAKLVGAQERCGALGPFCEWETLRLATCTEYSAEIMEMARTVERRWSRMAYVKQGVPLQHSCLVGQDSHVVAPPEIYISDDEAQLQLALVRCVEVEEAKNADSVLLAQRAVSSILASMSSFRASGRHASSSQLRGSHIQSMESSSTTMVERKSRQSTHDGARKKSRVKTRFLRGIDFLPFPKPCSRGHGQTATMDEFRTAMQPRAISAGEKREVLTSRAAENGYEDASCWVYHMNAQISQRIAKAIAPSLQSAKGVSSTPTPNLNMSQSDVDQSIDGKASWTGSRTECAVDLEVRKQDTREPVEIVEELKTALDSLVAASRATCASTGSAGQI